MKSDLIRNLDSNVTTQAPKNTFYQGQSAQGFQGQSAQGFLGHSAQGFHKKEPSSLLQGFQRKEVSLNQTTQQEAK